MYLDTNDNDKIFKGLLEKFSDLIIISLAIMLNYLLYNWKIVSFIMNASLFYSGIIRNLVSEGNLRHF